MNILYILVPVALLLAAAGVAGFIWSVRSGQFEDVETPGVRVLFEEDEEAPPQHPPKRAVDPDTPDTLDASDAPGAP